MTCAIYARVSTRDKGQDTANQIAPLIEYATKMGWQYTVYEEEISAVKKRPKFNEMMEAARLRKVDIVLCWKLDRFARSIVDFIHSIQELDRNGVRFIALTQAIDTDKNNPASRLMMNILAAFAEFERELISERTRAGLQRKQKEGININQWKIKQADNAAAMYRLHLDQVSLRDIAKRYNVSAETVRSRIREYQEQVAS